jgi:hypothetical protein
VRGGERQPHRPEPLEQPLGVEARLLVAEHRERPPRREQRAAPQRQVEGDHRAVLHRQPVLERHGGGRYLRIL